MKKLSALCCADLAGRGLAVIAAASPVPRCVVAKSGAAAAVEHRTLVHVLLTVLAWGV